LRDAGAARFPGGRPSRNVGKVLGLQRKQPWGQPYAPADGWDWGSNGRILNNLVVIAAAHLLTGETRYLDASATEWITCSAERPRPGVAVADPLVTLERIFVASVRPA
jgi:hypothetical protein